MDIFVQLTRSNMKLKLVPALLLLMIMISCKSKTAFDYSEAIVKMENELSADIAKADLKVTEYLEAQKTDSAIMMSQQMEFFADTKLKEIQKLEAPKVKEGDNFKKAAVRYFSYIKNIYTSFNRFTMAATDEQKETERERLAKIIKDKKEATDAMQEAQRKFAAANDFRIEKVSKE
jgi:hypothetical protein